MSNRMVVVITLAAVAGVALMGVALAVLATGSNCSFDPPPGDITTMTLVNDTRQPVEFVECANTTCSRYARVDGGDVVAPGSADRTWNHEACGREPVGVLGPSGMLLGCVILPIADPPKVTTWRVSQRVPCEGPVG